MVATAPAERAVVRSASPRLAAISHRVVGQGPPLVLVHGLSGSSRWWARNVAALAAYFRVYLVDLRGLGRSSEIGFTLVESAQHLAAWMERTGIERAALVGHSMGGLIAAELAADQPRRVERLVLVDAAIFATQPGYRRQALGLLAWLRYAPLGFLPLLVADAWRAGPLALARTARLLLSADLSQRLDRVQMPTLLVWGEHDTLVPGAVGEHLQACLPDARLVVIRGAAHNPMWDHPTEFNRLVLEFLRQA
jgi:pimeloyl-ACP methyl ester carboxylesterase